MTEIDAATQSYALAQQKIAEAKADGNTPALTFNMTQFHALSRIPPEIAGLETLVGLDLSNTQISDLSPLSGLKNLESLDITNTKVTSIAPLVGMEAITELAIDGTLVADLRPILYLKAIATKESGRLTFKNTPALKKDGKLLEADGYGGSSRIEKVLERLRKLPPWHPLDEKLPDLIAQMDALSGQAQRLEGYLKPPSEVPALSRQVQDLKAEVSASRDIVELLLRGAAELDATTKEMPKRLERFATILERRAKTAEADFNSVIEVATAAFRENNRLKAPVTLWGDKQEEHEKTAAIALSRFQASLGYIGLAILLLIALITCAPIDQLFAPIGCDLSQGQPCPGFSMKGLVVTAAVLTFFTILLWFARLQMKLYLAERHLALDARERRAFSETYVGLLAEGDTSKEAIEQRGLVYAALFRPGADGTVREEGGIDPAVTAAFSKFLASK